MILKPREPLKILNVIPSAKKFSVKKVNYVAVPTKLLRHDYLETLDISPCPNRRRV